MSTLLSIKPGVRIRGLSNECLLGITIAHSVYSLTEDVMTITSITDGDHMAGSLHNTGDAFDLRLPVKRMGVNLVSALREALGGDFDVVLEADHIHVEYDPV